MEEKLKEQFELYMEEFDQTEFAIQRKHYHSYRVMNLCKNIGNHNHLNEKDMEIVIISGLLHDYARFYQWTHYHTYRDLDSIDHGDKGVELLFEQHQIEKYCSNKEYYDEIYDAIKYHNKLHIPDTISNHNQEICKVVRDADKLDIYYLLGMHKVLLTECDDLIRSEIRDQFFNRQQIWAKEVQNGNEQIILQLSMLYDINFDYSCKYILDYKLIDKLFENIEHKDMFGEYFSFAKQYIVERMEEYARKEV